MATRLDDGSEGNNRSTHRMAKKKEGERWRGRAVKGECRRKSPDEATNHSKKKPKKHSAEKTWNSTTASNSACY